MARCLLEAHPQFISVISGGKAKHLDVLERNALFKSKSSTFRNAEDFFKLREILDRGKKIVIIGGGFLGSELACALGMKSGEKGAEIVQIFKESGNMGKVRTEHWHLKSVPENAKAVVLLP